MKDYQSLLFRIGKHVPWTIHGWRLESYSIKGDLESGLFILARYWRPRV